MQAYARKLKFRLAWWVTWWSICCILAISNILNVISAIFYPHYVDGTNTALAVLWAIILSIVVYGEVPSRKKLLAKDSNKGNVFAKVMLLEEDLKKQKNTRSDASERNSAEERIKVLQRELDEMNPSEPIQQPNKN